MKILTKRQFLKNKEEVMKKIRKGAVFIYPTDTIYGIGCNALNSAAVKRIRKIKKGKNTPFSVAVPSKNWILQNCKASRKALARLPGKYTLVLNMRNRSAVSREVNWGADSLGVRIPGNWFSKVVSAVKIPLVSTSVNLHGRPPMTDVASLDRGIASSVDFIVYDGPRRGRPSTIIDLTGDKANIVKR